jgi:predicted Zn-dependent protease
VLKKDPGHRVAATALAILYYNDKQYDQAITLLNDLTGDETRNLVLREMKSDILYQTGKIDESAEEIKQIMKVSDGYTFYDQYISSIPVEVYTDKYGTLDDKISILTSNNKNDSQNLITLSLCYLFKGDTDRAIDYLFQAKKTTDQ